MSEADFRLSIAVQIAKREGTPRVHGNGFIQLDVAPDTRLHVWGHRDIPRQSSYTGIHDHVFGFRSKVVVGRVFQVKYSRCPKAFGKMYRIFTPMTREGEDTVLVPADAPLIRLDHAHIRMVEQGSYYTMQPGEVHETVSDGWAATIMTKTRRRPHAVARVFVPEGRAPDNDFNRNAALSPEKCWNIIEEVTAGAFL